MSRGLFRQRARRATLVTSAAVIAAACSQSSEPPARTVAGVSRSVFSEDEYGVSTSPRVASGRVAKGGGSFKLGSPYKVAGRWYVPRENPDYDEVGVASWYGSDFHGRKTANGEVFDAYALTAAHPTMPLPCYAYVTNLNNGRTILVRVNDRGPYVNDRLIDLSYASAKSLGYMSQGRARVRVRYAGRAPLKGDDWRERQFLASQPWQQNSEVASNAIPTRDMGSPVYGRTTDDASDRWSPGSYRAALAGKPDPNPAKLKSRLHPNVEMASLDPVASPRYEPAPLAPFTPPPFAPAPFAPAQFAPSRMSLTAAPSFASTSGSGRTYIQVGIFRDRSNAERLRRELGSLGPIEVAPLQLEEGGEVYRVRLGPVSPDSAGSTQDQVAAYGIADAAIVSD